MFLRGIKLNISLVFISQSYFTVPKTIRLNATHCFIMKIPNKIELQQIASNHLSDIDFKCFINLYKDYTKESYLFWVNNTTLSSDNLLRFRKNLDRQTAKISALSSRNVSKYEFLTGKDIYQKKAC